MPSEPPWRIAPCRAPAIDMNLCTDSVLPGSIRPVPVALRLGFVATSLPHSWNFSFRNVGWGRSLPLLHSAIFNPDRLDCLPSRLCPPIEGSISCKRPENSKAESPGDHRRRPIPSACLQRLSWDFAKKSSSASLACRQGLARTQRRASVVPEPARA
jgi:hypothetical protein